MVSVSAGIMAYNEEANIGRLLQAVIDQRLVESELREIFVVASGCTDGTERIVREFIEKDRRIELIVQGQREGKASAINLFLERASGEILILESGDTIPDRDTFERLAAPFKDNRVGMTGAHPTPVNGRDVFIGYSVNLMWSLHHKIALMTPKLGELVAFRGIVKQIPKDTAVDEASIEAIVRKAGYDLRYVPDAIVYNKGPENVKDFIKQRRRIAAGHKHLMCAEKYEVSTFDPGKILKILIRDHSWNFKDTAWTVGAICLEIVGRILGYYDFYLKKKNPYIWDIAKSTKQLVRSDAARQDR
ncbi:glycosyltransferase [Syntrophorhabdus aromaticivorans]|uniref:Glycosyltransferase n=1 Tax=Syntrophorhabdus aromaticivorans TaxID=328301 RepID=A0A971M4L0_9BACT|nr:glycosyltransferase [Syntrophorhabdus aromaticivorans]NLW35006.1 glycosyltransferase [Syntrophorhabdus aromaticivorans]